MEMKTTLRLAHSAEDHARCAEIYLKSRQKNFDWLPPETFRYEEYETSIEEEEVWVAERAGVIVGFTSIYLPANFLHNLFVAPGEQGKGLGLFLLEGFLARVARPALLKCLQANQRALAFYQKHGWEILEQEEGELGPAWVMIKR
jgi:GNAT superfamily N-acetyltransferase